MRFVTIAQDTREIAGVVASKGIVPIGTINAVFGWQWETNLFDLIQKGQINTVNQWYRAGGKERLEQDPTLAIPFEQVKYGPLYRKPAKIFGIGLNYVDHAKDLSEAAPNTEPASFFKPFTTIIGPQDAIKIPLQSEKTTAEAELGVILGKACENIETENWLDSVAGYTTLLDMTAEDILRKNPRYLTRAKSFETFFSFGPQLITPDEIADVTALRVATVINGAVHAQNTVSNMTFLPDFLVAFHSKVMKWLPGDVLATGTPRAAEVHQGDVAECRIDGFEPLVNPVIDKKCSQ